MKRPGLWLTILVLIGIGFSFLFQGAGSLRPIAHTDKQDTYPSRVICVAPSIVECMYALGLEERIVGVSDFATFPPEAALKDRIGGYFNPNFERMIAMQPDLLLIQGRSDKYADFAREKNIPLLRVEMSDIDTICREILMLGDTFGVRARADSLVNELRQGLDEVEREASEASARPKVFLCMGRKAGSLSGLFTMGPDTFIGELLNIAGGENLFHDVLGGYPQVSKESLARREPDVIIEIYLGDEGPAGGTRQILEDWRQMPSLPAVANNRVYLVTQDYMVMPGPRMLIAAQTFFDLIHRP